MSTENSLCEWCVKIPLHPKTLNLLCNWEEGTGPIFQLGPGSRVEDSSCPFCTLVKHAYYES
jgi:hypothetical protein